MFNTRPWLYYDSSYNIRKFGTKFWIYYDVSNITNKFINTYIQGILDICGNIVLRNGGFSLPDGDVSMNGNLYVGKQSTFIGDVSMNGNVRVGKQSTFIGDVSMNGNLYVGKQSTLIGDVSMNGNLYVGLDTLFNRNITIKGSTTLKKIVSNTINASSITYEGINLQTTLDGMRTQINDLQASFDSLFGYFVLTCEKKGAFASNSWFSFGANIAIGAADSNPRVIMPTCLLIGYRIQRAANDIATSIVIYKNDGLTDTTYTITTGTGTTTQNTNIAPTFPFSLGNTIGVRFGNNGAGSDWRASFIFRTHYDYT